MNNKQRRAPMPDQASTTIDGRLHLHERHVHYSTPGVEAAIRGKGKTVPGTIRDGGTIAVGWVDVELFRGQEIWVTRVAAGKLLGRQIDWIERLAEARLVRHIRDGRGQLWVRLDPAWTPAHLEQAFISNLQKPKTLAEFDAYETGRGLFGHYSNHPHPEIVLDAVVDLLSDVGVFGAMEIRGVITLPLEPEELVKDLWARYLKRSRLWPSVRQSLDLDTFRLLMPPAIANARGTCWDEEEPDERPAPPPQVLARLAGLERIREEASLFVLLTAGRGGTTQYMNTLTASCVQLDGMIAAADADPKNAVAMTTILEQLAFDVDDGSDLTQSRRFDHARTLLFMLDQLDAVARRSPRDADRDLRPYALALPSDRRDFRRRLNLVGDKVRAEGIERREKSSAALKDGFNHVLAVARRRCDQVADVMDDALVEAAALDETDADYLDSETISWILNEDGTYGDGQQTIHFRVWKADRFWIRLQEKELLTYERHARKLVLDGLATGEHFERGKRYYQYRGVTSIGGSTPQQPWFATLFIDAATIAPGSLPLALRERRADLIKRWQLPGWRPMKGGLLSFRESSHAYRMGALDDITLMPLEEFDHAMRAAHLAFRSGMIVGCRINETLQMAHRGSEWPVLEIGPTARTGWLAVPKQTRGEGLIGDARKQRFFMSDDDTFRYFTEMAATVVRRSHPEGRIPDMPGASGVRWKTVPKPYAFSLDGLAIESGYLNTCLRYLLAGVAVCTLHDTRHAAANRGWVEGEDLGDTMLRLGHASERNSLRYRSPTASQADIAAAESLDRRVRGETLRYWESLFA